MQTYSKYPQKAARRLTEGSETDQLTDGCETEQLENGCEPEHSAGRHRTVAPCEWQRCKGTNAACSPWPHFRLLPSHSIPALLMLPPSPWHEASQHFYFAGESRLEKACDHTVSLCLYLLAWRGKAGYQIGCLIRKCGYILYNCVEHVDPEQIQQGSVCLRSNWFSCGHLQP